MYAAVASLKEMEWEISKGVFGGNGRQWDMEVGGKVLDFVCFFPF